MGGFTRWMEKVKQGMGFTPAGPSKDWRPTSNARNTAMIKEARKFALQLKAFHRDLSGWEKATDVALNTTKMMLSTPLPKAFDGVEGLCHAVDTEDRFVGAHVNMESISTAQQDLKQRLQQEVLHPLDQWLAAYRTIKERNRKCEDLRLDLDRKRRLALELGEKVERVKARGTALPKQVEVSEVKHQTEVDKVTRLTARFAEVEAEVFNALLTLIRDTSVLREYAAGALLIMQRCCNDSYAAFDLTMPSPTPILPPAAMASPSWQQPLPPATSSGGGAPIFAGPSSGGMGPMATMRSSMNNGIPTAPTNSNHPGIYPPIASGGGAQSSAASAAQPAAGDNPFQQPAPAQSASLQPAAATATPPAAAQQRPSQAELPAPAWYNEAKSQAKPGGNYDDSDEETTNDNPFAAK